MTDSEWEQLIDMVNEVSNDGTPYPQPLMDADDYRDLMNPISEDEYTSWS